jgi:hypothetical protein
MLVTVVSFLSDHKLLINCKLFYCSVYISVLHSHKEAIVLCANIKQLVISDQDGCMSCSAPCLHYWHSTLAACQWHCAGHMVAHSENTVRCNFRDQTSNTKVILAA